MNQVTLIGRLTKDPDVRYGGASQTAVARFTIAVDRGGKDRDGNDRGADFPSIVCFGKTAELVERYLGKGRLVGITGRIQTGSYEKDGRKVYTTDVLADRVEFLDRGDKAASGTSAPSSAADNGGGQVPSGFAELTDDDIPF